MTGELLDKAFPLEGDPGALGRKMSQVRRARLMARQCAKHIAAGHPKESFTGYKAKALGKRRETVWRYLHAGQNIAADVLDAIEHTKFDRSHVLALLA